MDNPTTGNQRGQDVNRRSGEFRKEGNAPQRKPTKPGMEEEEE